VVAVGVEIDVGSKLLQPSPSRGRGETSPFIDEALEALRRHARRTNRNADGDDYTPKRIGGKNASRCLMWSDLEGRHSRRLRGEGEVAPSSSFPNVASQHSQSDLVSRQSTTNLCSPSHTTVTVVLREGTNKGPYHGPSACSLLCR